MKHICIIGGGAAGLMAAGISLQQGVKVTVIERNAITGRKLLLTGKGRCNVTNNCSDINEMIKNVPTNGRFLYSAFTAFMPSDTMALLEQLGVPLKTERGRRVFPVSDKAADIADALRRFATGAKIMNGRAQTLICNGNKISACRLEDGSVIEADAFILATGGMSYPLTGSTGDGYQMARAVGHTVSPLKPSLVALKASNGFCPLLQGLTLKNVTLSLFQKGRKKALYSELGEMLFTHFGISGPLVLSASAYIPDFQQHEYFVEVDLKPGLDETQLEKRVFKDFHENANKDIINALDKLLPKKLIPIIIKLSGIDAHKKVNQITKTERQQFLYTLKHLHIDLVDFWSIEQAVITSGGIRVKEINPKTMGSKLYTNLYFAGEIIDVDAFTGGYNLQIAFSTAYTAATHATNDGGDYE
ncbi:MAG: aminoacetone oxidase family FAD-binding enzyme [Clostridia bacterium]|nr:aminoacetone oxidase family FAD-binding enzyme [Clostridia bacterium]